jgi:hypothetical protein
LAKKEALLQIEGLNLFLKSKKAQPTAAPNSFLPPENIWSALRAAKEKRAQMRSNFPKSSFLVHLCNLSWNQIVPSLGLMHDKLIEMGFEFYNGKIVINEIETEGSNYHAK